MNRPQRLVALLAATLMGGCVLLDTSEEATAPAPKSIARFSAAPPDDVRLPDGWEPWRISKFKKLTRYRLVDYNGTTVVKASASSSASGLVHRLDLDAREYPILNWRWKVPSLIDAADNRSKHAEDSPVRIIVSFDGDHEKLPLEERIFMDQARLFSGNRLPYATLMYIWENRAPRGEIIANLHTTRIRMVVAESGQAMTGVWKDEQRNVYEDFRRAFGEEPGRITGIAIMTDTDNTGAEVEAYYGDIRFARRGQAQGIAARE